MAFVEMSMKQWLVKLAGTDIKTIVTKAGSCMKPDALKLLRLPPHDYTDLCNEMRKALHPDKHPDDASLANDAYKRLNAAMALIPKEENRETAEQKRLREEAEKQRALVAEQQRLAQEKQEAELRAAERRKQERDAEEYHRREAEKKRKRDELDALDEQCYQEEEKEAKSNFKRWLAAATGNEMLCFVEDCGKLCSMSSLEREYLQAELEACLPDKSAARQFVRDMVPTFRCHSMPLTHQQVYDLALGQMDSEQESESGSGSE